MPTPGDIEISEAVEQEERESGTAKAEGTVKNSLTPRGKMSGGVWLNNLAAMQPKDKAATAEAEEEGSHSEADADAIADAVVGTHSSTSLTSTAQSKLQRMNMPAPKPGFEKDVEALLLADKNAALLEISSSQYAAPAVKNSVIVSNISGIGGSGGELADDSPIEMLKRHRGFQIKALERREAALRKKLEAIQ
jgi:hypothetical protein